MNCPSNHVEEPSYGFAVEELADRTIITIPKRQGPDDILVRFVAILIGGLAAMFLLMAFADPVFGGVSIFIACILLGMTGLLYLLSTFFGSASLKKKVIQINQSFLTINEKSCRYEHISSWMTRWVQAGGVIGSPAVVAIGSIMQSSAAKKSHTITFDYGDEQVVVASGFTEAGAQRIMEALQSALKKW